MTSPLQSIAKKILSNLISEIDFKSTLSEYKNLLLDVTSLDLNRSEHQKNIQLENGIAIGLNWASLCLDDTIRTQKFIRGTKLAIDLKLKEGKKPVQLLYAGTGPFATLILPLLSHFSPEQLQVTLLDVNPASIENVAKIIRHFDFGNHINEIRCADASKTIFKKANKFDILLSETMQHALQRELQVVICSHLLYQMSEEAILIPQSIDLDLVVFSSHDQTHEPAERIGEIMKVDVNFLRNQYPIGSNWIYEKQIKLPEIIPSETAVLAISTKIKVFGSEIIEWNESGLTVPYLLTLMRGLPDKNSIELTYAIDPEPGFKVNY